jgi:hypothetical protein
MKTLYFFLFLWVISALLDPDPATQTNADPHSTTLPHAGTHCALSPVLAAGAEPVPGPGAMFPALVYGRVGPGAAAPPLLLPPSLHLPVRARAGGPLLSTGRRISVADP